MLVWSKFGRGAVLCIYGINMPNPCPSIYLHRFQVHITHSPPSTTRFRRILGRLYPCWSNRGWNNEFFRPLNPNCSVNFATFLQDIACQKLFPFFTHFFIGNSIFELSLELLSTIYIIAEKSMTPLTNVCLNEFLSLDANKFWLLWIFLQKLLRFWAKSQAQPLATELPIKKKVCTIISGQNINKKTDVSTSDSRTCYL